MTSQPASPSTAEMCENSVAEDGVDEMYEEIVPEPTRKKTRGRPRMPNNVYGNVG